MRLHAARFLKPVFGKKATSEGVSARRCRRGNSFTKRRMHQQTDNSRPDPFLHASLPSTLLQVESGNRDESGFAAALEPSPLPPRSRRHLVWNLRISSFESKTFYDLKPLIAKARGQLGSAPRAVGDKLRRTPTVQDLDSILAESRRVGDRKFTFSQMSYHLFATMHNGLSGLHGTSIRRPGTGGFVISPVFGSAEPRCRPRPS